MAIARVNSEGWLTVPWDGPELAVVEIGVNGFFQAAFLDFEDGQRIAMIRHPAPPGSVFNAEVRHRPAEPSSG